MRKRILPLLLTAAVTLCGCTSLLERSYNVVEPYTNRYWDTGAEDTLRAESYQDLVNSLLMLVEQRSTEGIIRYYAENNADAHQLASRAKEEVLEETVLGSYLLSSITFTFTSGEAYATMNYTIHYRSTAGDPDSLMALSDTQSLVDLLRLAVRENHDTLTARFISPVSRETVEGAVESLWQELCAAEADADGGETDPTPDKADKPADETPEQDETKTPDGPAQEPEETSQPDDGSEPAETIPPEGGDEEADGEESGQEPTEEPADQPDQPATQPEESVADYPPCPWQIRFYPNPNRAEIVEILLD